jgi:hypothetical protein
MPISIAPWLRPALFAVGALVIAVATLTPGLAAGPSFDAAIFIVIGSRMLAGDAPYVDVWDHKPPGIYATDAAAQLVFFWADPWTAAWLASVVAVAAAGCVLAILLARRWSRLVTWVVGWLGVAALGTYVVSLGGGMSETFTAPWALGALLVADGAARDDVRRWLAAGVLAAIGSLVSLQAAPLVLALLVLLVGRSGRRPAAFAAVALGAWLVLVACIAALALAGALPAAVDQVLAYNAAYRSASEGAAEAVMTSVTAPSLATAVLSLLPLIVLALNGLIALARSGRSDPTLLLAAVAWLLGTVAFTLYQGRFYTHYAGVFVPPLAILAAAGAERLLPTVRRSVPSAAAVLLPLVLIGLFAFLVASSTGSRYAAEERIEWELSGRVGDAMRDAGDEGSIFVWGFAPDIHLRTDLAPATPYVYLYPLTTPGYSSAEQVDALLGELRSRPPSFVVDAGKSSLSGIGFAVSADDGRTLDLLDPVRDEIAQRYEPLESIGPWTIYVPRASEGGAADS